MISTSRSFPYVICCGSPNIIVAPLIKGANIPYIDGSKHIEIDCKMTVFWLK